MRRRPLRSTRRQPLVAWCPAFPLLFWISGDLWSVYSLAAGLGYQICDGIESFSGVGILEFASLSLDEPEMEAISFEEQVEDVNTEEEDGIAD